MPINLAIIGVGNCAKSFVEGMAFYTKNRDDKEGLKRFRKTLGL